MPTTLNDLAQLRDGLDPEAEELIERYHACLYALWDAAADIERHVQQTYTGRTFEFDGTNETSAAEIADLATKQTD